MMPYKKYIKSGAHNISRKTTFRVQVCSVPIDEYEWADNQKKMAQIWSWHHHHGLHRSTPHPMGKDLKELMRQYNQYHADRYKKCGMTPPNCYMTEGVA
jgi:hypothetical protein